MRHEGDAVAGESPGKSEQRKSSGETAPGERDPRLAVFRAAASETPPDGATAVLGTVTRDRSDTRAREGGLPETADVRDVPGEPPVSGKSDAGGDGSRNAGAKGERDQSPAPAEEPAEDAVREPEAEQEATAGVTADTDDTRQDFESAPEGVSGAQGPDKGVTADRAQPGAPKPDMGAQGASEATPGRATGPDPKVNPDSDPDSDSEPADAKPEPHKSDSGRSRTSGSDSASAAAIEDPARNEREPEPEPATKEPKPEPGPKPNSTAADAGAEAGAEAEADAEAGAASWGRSRTKKPEPRPASDADTDSAPKSGAGPAPKSDTDSAPKSAPAPAKSAPAPEEPPVDNPTAVFKALKRPPVDHPTTALKVPRPPADRRPGEGAGGSTFVPLRRDDKAEAHATAAPRAPAPPAPAPAASGAERTRQQPVPPVPPLDLLAELTNTPPPPQTPVRTAVRRVKIWTPLVLLVLIIFAIVQAFRPLPAPELTLSTPAGFTFEGGTLDLPFPAEGQGGVEVEGVGVIGMYGEQKPAPIASVAKTMTAYVILKDHPITGDQVGPEITVDKEAAEDALRTDESTVPIKEGQQFTQKQMLQMLMIPSANNGARLLARWDAKSKDAFVAKMNAAAKDLGMTSTTYTDPSGLDKTTVSTAADQLKLAKAVMQNDVFRAIVNTPDIVIPGIDNKIFNNNTILAEPGVSGIKTGSSTPAGGNLLWTADTVIDGEKRRIIGVVMGTQEGTILSDKLNQAIQNSLKLIKKAQDGVTSAAVVKKGEIVGYVDDGLGGKTALVATKDLRAVGWAGLKAELSLGDGGKPVPHSAKAGTVVGDLTIGTGDGKVTTPLAVRQDLAEPGFGAKLTRLG